jgi:hypothetical protein
MQDTGQGPTAPAAHGRRYGLLPVILLAAAAAIMLWNTWAHSPRCVYDCIQHARLIRTNQDPLDWRPHPAIGLFDHLPVFYYAALGKVNRLLELAAHRRWHPFYLFRVFHAAFIVFIAALYGFRLIPRLVGNDARLVRWFFAAAFLLPNLYLSQVMVRSDHFVFLFVMLLFYLWFEYDFPARMAQSPWRIAAWAALLTAMANSRNFCAAAYVVFLPWGLVLLFRRARSERWRWRLQIAALVLAVLAASSQHYVLRYLRTGLAFEQTQTSKRLVKHRLRAEGFDRRLLFLNTEFGQMLRTPDRHVRFKATASWPMRRYRIAPRPSPCDDDNNAFVPRLYSDMWGDHWLFFTSRTHRLWLKRAVLLAAAPFTLAYFLVPLALAASGAWGLLRGRWPSAGCCAGAIFWLAFAMLVLWISRQPEPGANGTVKFCYLMAYAWLPLIALAEVLRSRPRVARLFCTYTWALLVLCLPLAVFIR